MPKICRDGLQVVDETKLIKRTKKFGSSVLLKNEEGSSRRNRMLEKNDKDCIVSNTISQGKEMLARTPITLATDKNPRKQNKIKEITLLVKENFTHKFRTVDGNWTVMLTLALKFLYSEQNCSISIVLINNIN